MHILCVLCFVIGMVYFCFTLMCTDVNLISGHNLVCGCGDDLNAGHDSNAKSGAPNMYDEDKAEEARYLSFGRAFYNMGFRRRGTFRDLDVLAVHPAGIKCKYVFMVLFFFLHCILLLIVYYDLFINLLFRFYLSCL